MYAIPIMLQIVSYLTSPYLIWVPVAFLASACVIMILGLIYALSGFLGRTELRTWTRVKIYEVLFSLFLIIFFYFIAVTFFSINPTPAYKAVGILPDFSTLQVNGHHICASGTVNDFYSLSACDIRQFLQYTLNLNTFLYETGVLLAVSPTIQIDTSKATSFFVPGVGTSDQFYLVPTGVDQLLGDAVPLLYSIYVLNQVQLLIIASSLLIFSLFMLMGLMARIFVISRSFGGAMIAFAIGIGILYPLLVSITYGFIDSGLQQQVTSAGLLSPTSGSQLYGFLTTALDLLIAASFSLTTLLTSCAPGLTHVGIVCSAEPLMRSLIVFVGLVGVGLVLVPLLNFLVVETFIIDFSKAVGEKMDFLSLLTGLV